MTIDDELQALLLLSSLPESLDTLVVTLTNSFPNEKLSMDIVCHSLLNEAARRKERNSPGDSQANVFDTRGRSENRGTNKTRAQSRGRSKSHSRLVCYYCGEPSHKKSECRSFKRDQKAEKVKPDQIEQKKEKEKTTTVVATKEDVFFDIGNYLNLTCDDGSWVVDTGVTIHVAPNKSFFSSYKARSFGTIKMGNEDMCQIVGQGDIILSSNVGCQLILKDVRHVPDMRLNLVSVGRLDDDGFESHYSNGKWKLTKGNLVVARRIKEGLLIRDVVFFEDRTIEDIKKPEKPKHKIVDPFDPPVTRNETREVDAGNDPTISSDDQAEEQNEQAEGENNPAPVESAEPQLRYSTRVRQPST
ncbi:Retrovirus-related Pol polyprotein from transposon TNT 1-94 [Sesamum alatum]|uniref:Retrovirus-related Pol polyprotein from transposon TNT 1-94 n=1 Tax=Sesamum alatum TaxID=300844 RepID=A0AAE1YEX4_9LAMI|nr:Retrovirus-related Pol polyprotein from transposon TNT 1-94 [Sesamum alatum]